MTGWLGGEASYLEPTLNLHRNLRRNPNWRNLDWEPCGTITHPPTQVVVPACSCSQANWNPQNNHAQAFAWVGHVTWTHCQHCVFSCPNPGTAMTSQTQAMASQRAGHPPWPGSEQWLRRLRYAQPALDSQNLEHPALRWKIWNRKFGRLDTWTCKSTDVLSVRNPKSRL